MRPVRAVSAAILLSAALSVGATAQEDWSPRYVPPGTAPAAAPPPAAPAVPPAATGPSPASAPASSGMTSKEEELRKLAEQFAPVFYHRMAGSDADRRFDYPTNFDFDGDWTGNNNWANAADPQYKLWSFVYYSAIESDDYYFLYYVVFHPRAWSAQAAGGGGGIMDQIQQAIQKVTGAGQKPAAAEHENDLEGALVIVDKWAEGGPAAVAVETLAGNQLLPAVAPDAQGLQGGQGQPTLRLESGHPELFVGSQQHGIHPWNGEQATEQEAMVVWRYGKPVEISRLQGDSGTYELVSLNKTLWKRAQEAQQRGLTWGAVEEFGDQFCGVAGARRPACQMGVVGSALRGDYGTADAASAPWMWTGSDLGPGTWFFDPIQVLQQHFGFDAQKEKYLYNPYLGIGTAN